MPHDQAQQDTEHATAIANEMLKALDYNASVCARGLCHLAIVLVDRDPAAKVALAQTMLKLARELEPRLPLYVRQWH